MATEKGEFADRAAECASIIAAILERLFADAVLDYHSYMTSISYFTEKW